MSRWPNTALASNPGWRLQFRFRGSRLLVPGGWSLGHKTHHTIMNTQTMLIIVSLVGFVLSASADEIVRLTLTGVTYANGGFATGSITLDYPANGLAKVASFDVTLTDTNLTQASGYGSSATMISGVGYYWDFIAGPFGTNNTWQLGIYGSLPGQEQIEFWFDVPNSLITGSPPVDPVQFDPTFQDYDGAWFLLQGGIPPQDLVTGGTLNPEALGQQPPVLGISMNSATPTINISSVIGTTNQIQCTADISNTNGWSVLTNVVLQSTSATMVDTSATNYPMRFYRAVVVH
jgi:hypothetical protein